MQINVPIPGTKCAHWHIIHPFKYIRPRAVCLHHMRNSFRISMYPIAYTVKVLDVLNTSSQSGSEPLSSDRVYIVYRACKVHSIPSVRYQHQVQIYVKYNMQESEYFLAVQESQCQAGAATCLRGSSHRYQKSFKGTVSREGFGFDDMV